MLDPYLDNELLIETSQTLLEHLGFCADCAAELERRTEFRRLLAAALTDDEWLDSEDCARSQIQRALAQERPRALFGTARWLAAAACLILALGVASWWFGIWSKPTNSSVIMPTSQPSIFLAAMDRDAVENHQICALSYPSTWTFDMSRVTRALTPRFAPVIDAVGRDRDPYELIEGHVCKYQERQYAHLIYRNNDHTVSVFIEDDEPGDSDAPRPFEIDQASYKAYQVARVDTDRHHVFVVSDLPSTENLALANQLFPPTLDFVRNLEIGAS
jgi:anti-sigma factor RsiW